MTIDLRPYIREVPDWPKPGIGFKDITPLLNHPAALDEAIRRMADPFRDQNIHVVAGAESRGFIFGTAIAHALNAGFVPIRKPNKLPWNTHSYEYELEYGSDTLQVHQDAVQPGQRVLLADDLLATGGTMRACCELVRMMGGQIVGITFLVELTSLQGRKTLEAYSTNVHSVIRY